MRLVCFIGLVVGSVVLPWWFLLPLWTLYAFAFQAYELIALGMLLDAYFGYAMPWHVFYTVTATLVCIGAELVKPRIAFYGAGS